MTQRHNSDDRSTKRVDDNERLARWRDETEFEDDIREVMNHLRPHRQERLAGWSEYSAKGDHFRVTVSWDSSFDQPTTAAFQIPDIAEVLQTLLVGSARAQDEMDAKDEFELYAMVVQDLSERLKEMRARYD